jgi:hypothetical protein
MTFQENVCPVLWARPHQPAAHTVQIVFAVLVTQVLSLVSAQLVQLAKSNRLPGMQLARIVAPVCTL